MATYKILLFTINIFTAHYSPYRDDFITLTHDWVVQLNVSQSSLSFPRGSSICIGSWKCLSNFPYHYHFCLKIFCLCFFVLHCPYHLTILKIEDYHCCLELFQYVSICYSRNKRPSSLSSMVEVLWIGTLLCSRDLFFCLGSSVVRLLVFAVTFHQQLWDRLTRAVFCFT